MVFDRRKENKPYPGKDRRKGPAIGRYHLPKGGKRYQFKNLIVHFNPEFNVWQVINSSEPDWKNVIFEITGIENEKVAIDWALDYQRCDPKKQK